MRETQREIVPSLLRMLEALHEFVARDAPSERGQYQAAAGLLETMVKTWPERRDYRLQWSGAYQWLDQNHQALAVLELAERRALLGEAERLQLVRMARGPPDWEADLDTHEG